MGGGSPAVWRSPKPLWMLLLLMAASGAWGAAPVVDSFSASPTIVAPGGLVTLELSAHDPDCPSTCVTGCGLYIRPDMTLWSADGGVFFFEDNGTQGSPYAAAAQWQAPSTEATFTLSVSLSDSGGMMCGGRETTTTSLQIQVTSNPGNPPVIESLVAVPVTLYPGESSQLTCTASDPDSDPVTFSWSSDLGELTPGANGSAVFEAVSPGVATVTCTATDPSGAADSQSTTLAISDVTAERLISSGLASPHRVAVDSMGDLYVVDRGAGGITVVRLETGDPMYRLPMPDATSVAVDWQDRLLVGTTTGARVFDRDGTPVLDLGAGLGEASDVAVDLSGRRYVALYRQAGRVMVHDEIGALVHSFGSTGNGPAQFMSPSGVGVSPDGEVVVADSGHGMVKVFDPQGNLVRSFGGSGAAVGEFVELDDVAVDADGVIYASDHYQDWIQTFNPDGTLREVIGSYGSGLGEFKTAAGIAPVESFGKLVVASVNTPGLQVFQLGSPTTEIWPTPEAEFSVNSLDFSNQAVGSVSTPLDVLVINNGDAPLGIHEVGVMGPFVLVNRCDLVDPGTWCAFSVVFAPVVPGPSIGSMTIRSSAEGGPHEISLFGAGYVPAQVVLSSPRLDFTPQGVGTTSSPLSVDLSNSGTVPLAISGIIGTGGFGVTSSCGPQLAGGDSCTLSVDFTAERVGPATGSVTIESSAAGSPSFIALTGEGVLLELTPNPAGISFGLVAGGQSSHTEQIQVLNTGSGRVTVGAVELAGENSADFVLTTDYCSHNPVDIGQPCWIEVAYTPATTSHSVARLVIPTVGGLEFAVSLSGGAALLFADGFETGDTTAWVTSQAKVLHVAPSSVSFSEVDLGTETGSRVVTVTNHTGAAAHLGEIWIQGGDAMEFAIDHDSCSSIWLEPGESCRIGVTMLTLDEGSFTAVLVIPAAVAEKRQPGPVRLIGTVRWP